MPAAVDAISRCYVNGEAADGVSAQDRGFAYGDGIFETMAWREDAVRHFPLHYARLLRGCKALRLRPPQRDELAERVARACAGKSRAVVKLVVTRGPGARGYRPPAPAAVHCTELLQIDPWPDFPRHYYERGVRLRLCRTPAAIDPPRMAGLKHLNRLPQVLARMEWRSKAIQEGLMLDPSGAVVGGTMSNVFLVRGSQLTTPALVRCGVAGVMRRVVLRRAKALGWQVRERRVSPDALARADELFVTNALIGVWPVRRFEDRRFDPGPLAAELLRSLDLLPGNEH